ncbi:MAG: hypothetical protein ABIS39_00200 [Sphingomicrobium sp.]
MVLAIALVGLAAPVAAEVINAEEFYQRATKVKKRGPFALLSMKEVKVLVNEVKSAGAKVKETRLAAEKAGKKGRYCPPPENKRMGHEEYVAGIGAIPQAERRKIDLIEATARMLASKFPCR